jgi:hypothetical protein
LTLDYGARTRRRGPPLGAIALAVGVPILLLAIVASWFWQRQAAIADSRAWTITGPPCPVLSRAAYLAQPTPATHAFDYNDVVFASAYGAVSCNAIINDGGRGWGTYPVCQFTSPSLIRVATRTGEAYFQIPGGPATVTVRQGVAACVLNGWFRGVHANDADTAVGIEH